MYYWQDEIKAMGRQGNSSNVITGLRYGVVAWKSPRELEMCPSLWGEFGVLPQGVIQGPVGDCWLLAAAASVAEYPERIKRIFVN